VKWQRQHLSLPVVLRASLAYCKLASCLRRRQRRPAGTYLNLRCLLPHTRLSRMSPARAHQVHTTDQPANQWRPLRHRWSNPVFRWQVAHAARLWLLVRAAIAVLGFFLPGVLPDLQPEVLPTGVPMAVFVIVVVVALAWVSEIRFGLKALHANLGYSSPNIRIATAIPALLAETLLGVVLAVRG